MYLTRIYNSLREISKPEDDIREEVSVMKEIHVVQYVKPKTCERQTEKKDRIRRGLNPTPLSQYHNALPTELPRSTSFSFFSLHTPP